MWIIIFKHQQIEGLNDDLQVRNRNKKEQNEIVRIFDFERKETQLAIVSVGFYILYVKRHYFMSCKMTLFYYLLKKIIYKKYKKSIIQV